MRLLSLFSGTGAIECPFRACDWEVQSVDIDNSHGCTIQCDILLWDFTLEPKCDVLFAGCPCEACSIANARGVGNLALADKLVRRTWEVIEHFIQLNPNLLWFVINPDSSLLWKREVANVFTNQVQLDFCQYGKLYRERTRLATNALDYKPRALCRPATCHSCVNGRHIETAQRGPCKRGGQGDVLDVCTLDQLHAYPSDLCFEIFELCCLRQ
jgi:hypothetical protein